MRCSDGVTERPACDTEARSISWLALSTLLVVIGAGIGFAWQRGSGARSRELDAAVDAGLGLTYFAACALAARRLLRITPDDRLWWVATVMTSPITIVWKAQPGLALWAAGVSWIALLWACVTRRRRAARGCIALSALVVVGAAAHTLWGAFLR
jgi:hypothetical protein